MPAIITAFRSTDQASQLPTILWDRARAKLGRNTERALSIPSELALRVMNHKTWSRAVPQFAAQQSGGNASHALSAHSSEIVLGLERDGVFATTLDELAVPGGDAVMTNATEIANRLMARSAAMREHRPIVAATAQDFLDFPHLFQWGLSATLLDIVETYLGQTCAYDGLEAFCSRPDGRETSTRLWHRDREDTKMVKVAIYLNDVDTNGGPFEILHPTFQTALEAKLSWRYEAISDVHLKAMSPTGDHSVLTHSLTGPKGTVIVVDPARCHHRGKPPTKSARSAIFYSYFARVPRHPFCCERSPLSRAQRTLLAAQLPARARECVQWREALPLSARLIPRNRLSV